MRLFYKQIELSLIEKLASFKSTFTLAHAGAVELQGQIEQELQSNAVAVALAKTAQAETEKLKKENEVFISNLQKFI